MAFMEPEYLEGDWYVVENTAGEATFLPFDVVGELDCLPGSVYRDEHRLHAVRDYIEGTPDSVVLRCDLWGARLSAPGYTDCTDWSVFDTEQEARDYISEQYDVDPDTGDELTDE